MFKICVYAICKNEEMFAEKWMESMSEADIIVVTDTGSTDKTAEKLKALGATVYEEKIVPWRFDVARNLSLSHVPDDVDICVCTDLDELFQKGWREKLENAWRRGTNRGNYSYNWSLKADGTADVQFNYFKVHTKKDYIWVAPVHEYLEYTGEEPEKKVFIEGMVLNHYPDNSKSRSSYLPLLELAVQEKPTDPRSMYYLGREYMYAEMWDKCIKTLNKFLALPNALWREERCSAMRCMAKAYLSLENTSEAFSWYYRAIAECPSMRDAYIEFAQAAYAIKDWNKVFFLTGEALKITRKSDTYINMGYSWDHTPHDLAAISCYELGMYELSLYHTKKALSFSPNDERLNNNYSLILEKVNLAE